MSDLDCRDQFWVDKIMIYGQGKLILDEHFSMRSLMNMCPALMLSLLLDPRGADAEGGLPSIHHFLCVARIP